MIKLAIGMLFILMNFALDIGDLSINILPEFVGYGLILSAVDKLKVKSSYFDKMSGVLFFMLMYKIADYIMTMLNVNAGMLATVFFYGGIITTIIGFIIQFRVFCGIDEITYNDDVRVRMGRIFVLFKVEVVLAVLAYISTFLGIYYNYLNWGEMVPGLTRPIFKVVSMLPEDVVAVLNIIGVAAILIGVVVKFLMILFTFEACTDYDKIMTERSGRK